MTKIIAHRGYSEKYPENTMLAFQKAVEAGSDGIELDVQLSADGQPVILHDENLKRTANRPGLVKDFTLRELQSFDAGNGFPASFGVQPIPSLREYFSFIRQKNVFTNIELKTGVIRYEGIEEKVISLIREFGLTEKVLFSSFNHFSMLQCKQLAPEIRCALLTASWQVGAGAYARSLGVEFVNPFYSFLTEENIRELREHGIGAQAWTVNDEPVMEYLVRRDIFAVITNRPETLYRVRQNMKGEKIC